MLAGETDRIILDKTKTRDHLAPAKYVAGWYSGLKIGGEVEQDYIVSCYRPNDDLTDNLYDAIEAYSANETTFAD